MAVMPESTSARVHDSLAARCRYVNSTCPRLIRGYSSATGSLTLQTRSASAHTSSAAPRICAPAATKSSSGIEEPAPASFSTTTVWPRTVSSCTPEGVMATRYSLSLTSRAAPTRTAHLFRLGRAFAPPRSLGAHELLFPALRARRSIRGCVEEMSDFAQPRRTPRAPTPPHPPFAPTGDHCRPGRGLAGRGDTAPCLAGRGACRLVRHAGRRERRRRQRARHRRCPGRHPLRERTRRRPVEHSRIAVHGLPQHQRRRELDGAATEPEGQPAGWWRLRHHDRP